MYCVLQRLRTRVISRDHHHHHVHLMHELCSVDADALLAQHTASGAALTEYKYVCYDPLILTSYTSSSCSVDVLAERLCY